jgi:hypothetical protein
MGRFGPEAEEALRFIQKRGTRVSVHAQPTGARWTVDRRIEIHPRFVHLAPDDLYAASLIMHEVRHLQQGALTALSVYGELEAWQLQFGFLKSWTGRYHNDPSRGVALEQLMALRLGWDRTVLDEARSLMQAYAGKAYRVDLLPLYPLHREIVFLVSHKQPGDGWHE